jgi:hypothetical protein
MQAKNMLDCERKDDDLVRIRAIELDKSPWGLAASDEIPKTRELRDEIAAYVDVSLLCVAFVFLYFCLICRCDYVQALERAQRGPDVKVPSFLRAAISIVLQVLYSTVHIIIA